MPSRSDVADLAAKASAWGARRRGEQASAGAVEAPAEASDVARRPTSQTRGLRHAARADGRRFAWWEALEVVVQEDGAATLAWNGEAFASARWDGTRLQIFRPTRVLDVPGLALRGAIEGAECLLRVAVGEEAPRELATWSPLEEVGDLLRAVLVATPPPRAQRALVEALHALQGPMPTASVVAALAATRDPLLAAVLRAVEEVLDAVMAAPWLRPPTPSTPARPKKQPEAAAKDPPKPRGRPRGRIRYYETWF